ncbi:MAG: DegT/DnrJ/EryC1/StrS family aminotransferase [candidate division KSB1 bacterium]|nr:DegT/DnrJ/EryC1/StrS family aminotransferase [candidate division KSB1 bacterium]
MQKVPFVDLKAQYTAIASEIDEAINRVLNSSSFILGKEVEQFESDFARYCGVNYGVAVNSGTSALHLALLACGIGPGDEVITVPNTFVATVEAILYTGAKPVFVDIDPLSYNIDVNKIEEVITKKTRALIPVHLYGQPADMEPIKELASEHKLKIIEDACQAHGAEYKGQKVGSLADVGCFSFYPGKNLGAYGEGGMVVTNDREYYEKMKRLRDHGQSQKYFHSEVGFNYRMEGMQGAILRTKLKYLDQWTEARRKNAQLYNKLLKSSKVVVPQELRFVKHVYHLYVIRTEHRDELQQYLWNKGIATGLHYPVPIHLQKGYTFLGYKTGSFPVTEKYAQTILSLPMYPELTKGQIEYVVEGIESFGEL